MTWRTSSSTCGGLFVLQEVASGACIDEEHCGTMEGVDPANTNRAVQNKNSSLETWRKHNWEQSSLSKLVLIKASLNYELVLRCISCHHDNTFIHKQATGWKLVWEYFKKNPFNPFLFKATVMESLSICKLQKQIWFHVRRICLCAAVKTLMVRTAEKHNQNHTFRFQMVEGSSLINSFTSNNTRVCVSQQEHTVAQNDSVPSNTTEMQRCHLLIRR